MPKAIEIYVRSDLVPIGVARVFETISPGHECTRRPIALAITENVLPEADALALKAAEEVSNETGRVLKIYDLSTFKGRIRAYLKGVKNTPTVVLDNKKAEGIAEKDQLISLLERKDNLQRRIWAFRSRIYAFLLYRMFKQ